MIYTLKVQSLNLKYFVFYFTEKIQNYKSRYVNSTPSNLVRYFFVAHNNAYFRLRYCMLEVYIITNMYIFYIFF
jgi:hypothetical protein